MKKFTIKSCCGKSDIVIETNFPITKNIVDLFEREQFIASTNFIKNGIFKVESDGVIATCPLNSNKIQLKCKNNKCQEDIIKFENILLKLEKI